MSEEFPKTIPEREPTKQERIIALARELSEVRETFPFTGIDPEAYLKMKADIAADEDRSSYDISSPTLDELIERFRNEGVKVVLGRSKDGTYSGTVFVMPMGSDDVQSDSLIPGHLQISDGMNEKLRELVLLSRG